MPLGGFKITDNKSLDWMSFLHTYPVIPALRFEKGKKMNFSSIRSGGPCFLLNGNINTLRATLNYLEKYFSITFLHFDLFSGLSPDNDGLVYLKKQFCGIHGIISTRSRTLSLAKKHGFMTIFRIFLLDSESLSTGLKVASQLSPDAIEVLPGIIFPAVQPLFPVENLPPLICGGFIRDAQIIKNILQSGAAAVSTSSPELWS